MENAAAQDRGTNTHTMVEGKTIVKLNPKNAADLENVHFRDCTFRNIQTAGVKISGRLTFSECSFEGDTIFKELEDLTGSSLINNTKKRVDFNFVNCTFKGNLSLNAIKITDGSINFNDCILHGNVEVEGLQMTEGEIPLEENFNLGLNFKGCQLHKGINISNSGLTLKFVCTSATGNFVAENSIFDKLLQDRFSIEEEVVFNNCLFKIELNLKESTYHKYVEVNQLSATMTNSQVIKALIISSCEFVEGFTLEGKAKKSTVGAVGTLALNCNDSLKGSLQFTNSSISVFDVKGGNTYSNIFLQNCIIDQCTIHSFINKGSLSFFNVSSFGEASQLIISESVMGKFFIANCFFDGFKKVEIYLSNFSESSISNVSWFNLEEVNKTLKLLKSQSRVNEDPSYTPVCEINRDLFRQIKNVLERQGDLFSSLIFRKMEMRSYREQIKFNDKNNKRFGDRFILWLSWSNDYGDSWTRPILLTFITVLVFYIAIGLVCNRNYLFDLDVHNFSNTVKYLWTNGFNYFILLNPARRTSELFTGFPLRLGWLFFFDFLERLVLSYFIFQIVSAFRKFLK